MDRRILFTLMVLFVGLQAAGATTPVLPGRTPPATQTNGTAGNDLLAQADQALASGNSANAYQLYRQVIQQYPDSQAAGKAVAGVSNSLTVQHQYQAAIEFLEYTITSGKNSTQVQAAKETYTRLSATVDAAQRNAYQAYMQVKAEYDSIPWYNIFRIFEKFRVRSQLKQVQADLDYICQVKMYFNPVYLVNLADSTTGQSTPTGSTHTNANQSTTTGTTDVTNKNQSTTSDKTTTANTNGSSTETSSSANSNANVNTNASADANGNSNASVVVGKDQVPLAADAVKALEERAHAVKVLEDELSRILALIPADKRDEARRIIVAGGGYPAPATAPTTSTTSAVVTNPTTTVPTEPTLTTTPPAAASDPTTSADQTPAASAAVAGPTTPAEATSTTTAVVTPAVVTEPVPTNVAGQSLEDLQQRVVSSYRRFQEAMRSGDRNAQAQAQSEYVLAVQALRTLQAMGGANTTVSSSGDAASRTVAPAAATSTGSASTAASATSTATAPAAASSSVIRVPPTIAPTGSSATTTTSGTASSVIRVPPTISNTSADLTGPLNPTAVGGQTSATTMQGVDRVTAPGGRPMNDDYLRSLRGGLGHR